MNSCHNMYGRFTNLLNVHCVKWAYVTYSCLLWSWIENCSKLWNLFIEIVIDDFNWDK